MNTAKNVRYTLWLLFDEKGPNSRDNAHADSCLITVFVWCL